jgi:meiotically up-regulated gene 157 (Mug157) protein
VIRAVALLLALSNLIIPLTGKRVRPVRAESLFHTLFANFYDERDGTTFVETGDIHAMWLRDSSAQALAYIRFAAAYPLLAVRLAGVVQREANNVITDPYANGFDEHYRVWERKWEAGSIAWPAMLAWTYWKTTGYSNIFTPQFHAAMRKIVDTWRCEQLHKRCSRYNWPEPRYTSDAYNGNTGMVWTAFRPSDDPVLFRFNIPQEIAVAIALQEIGQLAIAGYHDTNLANEANSMAVQVATGVLTYGRVWNSEIGGWMYAYETDGLGHYLFMDDANIPNLTSIPYLGWSSAFDPVYLNTRAYVLSTRNPWYFRGVYAQGLGSPHTPQGFIWPLGIIARAITATSSLETSASITTLAETDSEEGLIHESFNPDAYWVYTRAYFGWGNALYAELLFRSVAGFTAVPFPPYGTAVAFQRVTPTPSLTRVFAQLQNTTILYGTLGDLLAEAGGKSIIPRMRAAMQRQGNHPAIQWRQLEDSREPIPYAPNLR